MSEHTKGRLLVAPTPGSSLYHVHMEGIRFGGGLPLNAARRLAACWNHCENVDTDVIEAMTYADRGEACRRSELDLVSVRKELNAARVQNEKLTAMVQEQDRLLGQKACATKECRELHAARALLREVLAETDSCETWHNISVELHQRVESYLDACDTPEGKPNAG